MVVYVEQVRKFFLQKKKIRKTDTIALYALCFTSTKLRKVVFRRFQCLTMCMISYLEHLLINCRILCEPHKFRKYLTEKNCYVLNQKRKQPNDHTISTSPNMDLLFVYVAIFREKIAKFFFCQHFGVVVVLFANFYPAKKKLRRVVVYFQKS